MLIRRSVNSTELLKVEVQPARRAVPVDVTTYGVEMAVVLEGVHPVDTDFHPGAWETIDGRAYAVIQVGPGSLIPLTMTDEVYIPWARVSAGTERPELKSTDVIEVY